MLRWILGLSLAAIANFGVFSACVVSGAGDYSVPGQALRSLYEANGANRAFSFALAGSATGELASGAGCPPAEGGARAGQDACDTAAGPLRREFEDYDYEGGSFPGGQDKRGFRARFRSDLLRTDFFYQSPQQTNTYRPSDPVAIPAFEADGHYLGSTTPDDWWRYTFEVAEEGYVKIAAVRAASEGGAMMEFLWDENHQGWFSFDTGGLANWQVMAVDTPAFQSSAGQHTLRIVLSVGKADLDYFEIEFQQEEPLRSVLFDDDFESYQDDDELKSTWTVIGSGVGGGEGAWRLWSTTGSHLGYYSPDLSGMFGKYVISDAELAGPGNSNEQLITPEIDCTGYVGVLVQFGSNVQVYEDDVGTFNQFYDLDISTHDEGTQSWSDWANVFHHEGADGDDSSPRFIDISGQGDGKKIKLRWRFWQANYDYWWAIDNVRVTAQKPVTAGRILSVQIAPGRDKISLTWESFGPGFYVVQHTEDLSAGGWSEVPGVHWPIPETSWTGAISSAAKSQFYRVVSAEKPTVPGKILSIGITEGKISLTWEPFGTRSYRVQYSDNLASGVWTDVPGVSWPITQEQWSGDDLSAGKFRFYRVISE